MEKGEIFQIQNYSVNDGEGIRTTIFFTGCPLRCIWCANPEGFYQGNYLDLDTIINKINPQKIFYQKSGGGVTFSGGEATMQNDFLEKLTTKLYNMGINLALETCGHFDFEKTKPILEKMDMIFFDIKHIDKTSHKEKTTVSNQLILENAIKVYNLQKPMVIRVPLIIGYNDSKENLDQLAEFIITKLPKVKIEILPYHKLGEEKYKTLGLKLPPKTIKPPTTKELDHCKTYLQNKGITLVSYN